MSSVVLDQLTGPFKDVQFEGLGLCKHFKYGVHSNVEFTATGRDEVKSDRHRALFTNVLSPAGNLTFRLIDDVSEISGLNARVIGGQGTIDESLMADALKATGRIRPGDQQEIALTIAAMGHECHSGVLFNLLRMRVYFETEAKYVDFGPDDTFYDDGHVAQTYQQYLNYRFDRDAQIEFNYPIETVQAMSETVPRDGDYMVNLSGFNSDELTTLVAALSGWEYTGAVRLFSSIPKLAERVIIPYWNKVPSMSTFDRVSLSTVKTTIRKLVFNNRLEVSFDMAYSTLAAIMFSPLPRAIEANAWVTPNLEFYIGKAQSVRGMVKELTSGPAFSKVPSANLTWETYKANYPRLFIHATAFTEAIYAGLYELVTYKSDNFEATMAQLGLENAAANSPYNFAMACAAYRFGKEFELKQTSAMGPDFAAPVLSAQYGQAREINVMAVGGTAGYTLITERVGDKPVTRVMPRYARPAMFPLLSLGINDDRYYLNALNYTTRFWYDRVNKTLDFDDATEVNKAMAILRIGGYDAVVFDPREKVYHANWAANSNGQVMPQLRPGKAVKFPYSMRVADITKRKHNWLKLPTMDGEVSINIKISPVDYAAYRNGCTVRAFCRRYEPVLTVPDRMAADTAATFVYRTKRRLGDYHYKDFIIAETDSGKQPYPLELSDIPKSQYSEQVIDQDGQDQAALEQE